MNDSDALQLGSMLRSVQCEEYFDTFSENGIDLSLLTMMDKSALKELGITKVGDRLRLQILIEILNMEKVKAQVPVHELATNLGKWYSVDAAEDTAVHGPESEASGNRAGENWIAVITQDGKLHTVNVDGCYTASTIKKKVLESVQPDGTLIADEWSTYYIDKSYSVHLMFNVELTTVCNSKRSEKSRIIFCRTGEAPSQAAIGKSKQIISEGGPVVDGNVMKRIMGQRPPSQLISTNLGEYFPGVTSKDLKKVLRNSYRLSRIGSKLMAQQSHSSNASNAGNASNMRNSIYSNFSGYSAISLRSGTPNSSGTGASMGLALPMRINQTVGDVLLSNNHALTASDARVRRTPSVSSVSSAATGTAIATGMATATAFGVGDTVVDPGATAITGDLGTATFKTSLTSLNEETEAGEESFIELLDDEEEDDDFLVDAYNEMLLDDATNTSIGESVNSGSLTSILTSEQTQGPSVWHKGSKIGQGSYGSVYLGLDGLTGELMAVKEVDLPKSSEGNRNKMVNALKREMNLLRELDHENIVRYLGSAADASKMYIFLEYIPGGSVSSMLQTYGPFEEPLVRNFLTQVLIGVRYLHSKGIIHRDIKGANILLDINGTVKIGDFGISKKTTDVDPSSVRADAEERRRKKRASFEGSVYWMAPEVVKQTATTEKSDIWSVGCLAIEMLTGQHPYPGFSQMQTIFRIGTLTLPEFPTRMSRDAQDFLRQTFETDWKKRVSAGTLLKHAFLRKVLGSPERK